MCDVHACLGYHGEDIVFVKPDQFAYISGNGVCLMDVSKGPRDIIWRPELGISKFVTHLSTNRMVLVPKMALGASLEVVDLTDLAAVGSSSTSSSSAISMTTAGFSHHHHRENHISLKNPTEAKIVDVAFTRTGDRLYAITGDLDPKLICWDTSPTSDTYHEILFVNDLPHATYKKCVVNPLDGNKVCMYGGNGLLLATVTVVMDTYNVKLDPIAIDQASSSRSDVGDVANNALAASATTSKIATIVRNKAVTFATWTNSNRLLIGSAQGSIYDVDPHTLNLSLVAKVFAGGRKSHGQTIIPTCAVLTITSLIVGTSQGSVHWFPLEGIADALLLANSNEGSPLNNNDLCHPVQIAHQHSQDICSVVSLAISPNFEGLYVGYSNGAINQFSAHLAEGGKKSNSDDGDDVVVGGGGGTRHGSSGDHGDDAVVAVQPNQSWTCQNGTTLCSTSLVLPVSGSGRLLSLFVTGSYLGQLTFWRQPSVETEPMTIGMNEVRKSMPRKIKIATTVSLAEGSSTPASSASGEGFSRRSICQMAVSPTGGSADGSIVFAGTADGWLEVFEVSATEAEEEEEEGNVGNDDDEGGAITTHVKKVSRKRFFANTSLSFLTLSNILHLSTTSGDSSTSTTVRLLAIGSHYDSNVYILSCSDASALRVLTYFSVGGKDGSDAVRILEWRTSTLWIGCKSGKVYSFQAAILGDIVAGGSNNKANNSDDVVTVEETETVISMVTLHDSWDSGLPITGGHFTKGNHLLLNSSDSTSMTQIAVEDRACDELSRSVVTCCSDHSDFIICRALCPNSHFWATGCADGTIFLWNAAETQPGEWKLANKLHLHSSAVLTLTFSRDSSLLLTSAADGSQFLISIDRYYKPRIEKMHTVARNVTSSSGSRYSSSAYNQDPNATWLDANKAALERSIKRSNEQAAAAIASSIDDISMRLAAMLERNMMRNELEMLERDEFVVDVAGRDAVINEGKRLATNLRNAYTERNLWNELIAARIREQCWGSMQVKAVQLLPFSLGGTADKNVFGLSSFSVQKATDDEIAMLDKIKRLRAVEMMSQRNHEGGAIQKLPNGNFRVSWATSSTGCPQDVSWMHSEGARWPSSNIMEILIQNMSEQSDKKEGGGQQGGDGGVDAVGVDAQDDDNSISSLEKDNDFKNIDDNNILNLLYHPQGVRTRVQKRTQIALLKEVVRMIRIKFNECFDKLLREKDEVIASIDSRNARIAVILGELQQDADEEQVNVYNAIKMQNCEIPGSIVKVGDDEVESRPYENEAAKAARKREEEERRRQEAESSKADIKGRALDEMMHGTLEVKRDVFAEASSLQRPAWMEEIPLNEMTDSQLKEYDAFETRWKALQDEQLKYKKTLEQEMKKLRLEIVEVCKSFDEKLVKLGELKIAAQREVLAYELYIARLALSMAKRDQGTSMLKWLEKKKDELRALRSTKRTVLENFSSIVENVKMNLAAVQEEEKNLDKSFKRDLQNLCNTTFDQDALKVFTQLYRQRAYPEVEAEGDDDDLEGEESEVLGGAGAGSRNNASNRASKGKRGSKKTSKQASSGVGQSKKGKVRASKGASSGGKDLGPMQRAAAALSNGDKAAAATFADLDPFYAAVVVIEKAKVAARAQIPLAVPLSLEQDCPDGFNVDQFTWSQLQDLRMARIKKEIEAEMLLIEYTELKSKYDALAADDAILAESIRGLDNSRKETISYISNLDETCEVIVCLRQGQDEVDKDAIVTNYENAMLMPTEVVDKFNSRIKELGKDKIGVLTRIKEFRRKINLISWEANHLGLEAKHYEEYFTDLQLLRVTRELQHVIREGSDATQAKERLDRIAARKAYLENEADTKLRKIRRGNEAMRRQLTDRSQELRSLEDRIRELTAQVVSRKNVKQSRDEARGKTSDPVSVAIKKMKKVVARRHLVDTARAQAEEIDFLRQELDRIRMRTFPSFVRRRVSNNPDER